ncbi:unnamed protein product [Closterium sp. NIES-53]
MGDAGVCDASDPKLSVSDTSEASAAASQAAEPLGAQQAVMIFVKRPAPGRVKTRLAAGVGANAACDFYRACCEHVVTRVVLCPDLRASTQVFIFFSEPSDEGEIKRWMQQLLPSSTSLRFVSQVEGDVGARMQAAFQHVLGLGYHRVVVIGTDIPDVDGATVDAALSALNHNQVVFGLALDGGYYLLGLTAVLPCLFNGIEWSTDRVLQQSLSALHTNGVADVAPLDSLPRLRDIDTVHDLTAWLAEKQLASREDGTMKADGGADVEENAALTDCGKAGNGKDGSRTEQTSETAEKEDASLSGCGKTGHTDDALRAEHVGVHWTSHAPGVVSVAVVGGMEGGTEAMSLITVVARILGQVSPVGAM